MLNFPNTPTLNQLFPATPTPGLPQWQWDGGKWVTGPAATAVTVASVFGRTGNVVAAANDYSFAQLSGKPSTCAGYGLTDAVQAAVPTVFTAQQSFALAALTDAANITWDVSHAQKAKVTLAGNRTMNAVSNPVEGTTYTLWVFQDATGSRTLTWTQTATLGAFDFGTSGPPQLTATPNKADILCFECVNIVALRLRFTGIQKGFG
jgi:hypothetical protein